MCDQPTPYEAPSVEVINDGDQKPIAASPHIVPVSQT
jgi:hypothetical protein